MLMPFLFQTEEEENGRSILQLFANAQKKYDEENKVLSTIVFENSSVGLVK
jgi:hypothetical protein